MSLKIRNLHKKISNKGMTKEIFTFFKNKKKSTKSTKGYMKKHYPGKK